MDKSLALFAIGASSALFWPFLPNTYWVIGMSLLLAVFILRRRYSAVALFGGLLWMAIQLPLHLHWLDKITPKHPQQLDGEILAINSDSPDYTQILLKAKRLDDEPLWPKPLVRLNLYAAPPDWQVGSYLKVRAQLFPARGLANRAGRDGRRIQLGKGITASANFRSLIEINHAPPNWRERWLKQARSLWTDLPSAGLLAALTFGEQQGITSNEWQLFRNAGLTHVIAISGQHIAVIALLGWWLGRLFGQRGALICAAFMATLYSAIAGFGVPTERALIMVLLFSGLRLIWRYWPSYRLWLWAFVLLLLWDPLSLFAAGFWLSFAAVALLLFVAYFFERPTLWRIQLAILLGLLPLQLVLFEGIAPLAFVINLLALPLFTLLIIPLALLGVLLVPFGHSLPTLLFWICDGLLQRLLQALTWLNQQAELWWPTPNWAMPITLTLLIILAALAFKRGRWLLAPALLLLGLFSFTPKPQNWNLHVLDVGQGLSVLLEDGKTAILYDSGDRMPNGYSMAESVIAPVLYQLGIEQIQLLISSHNDRDHAGGRDYLYRHFPIIEERSSFTFAPKVKPCRAGDTLAFQGMNLTFLSPDGFTQGNNNDSCVVRVDFGTHSLLLTGDLEKAGETDLVRRYAQKLASTIVVAPHHGSNSSSTAPFIQNVSPQWVIYATGMYNRWGFPKAKVMERYQKSGAMQLNSGELGAISFYFDENLLQYQAERQQGGWYRRQGAWWKPRLWLE